MKELSKKFFLLIFVAGLGFVLTGQAQDCCGKNQSPVHPPRLEQIQIQLISKLLAQGDFQQVRQLLSSHADSSNTQFCAIKNLLEEYEIFKNYWQQQDHTYYLAYMKRMQNYQDQDEPVQPEKILEVLYKARDLAWEKDNQVLNQDPFVQEQVAQLQQRALKYQQQGEYEKAWRQALRWIIPMNPEDEVTRRWAADLTEKRFIETLLSPDICPDQPDPYGLIRQKTFEEAMVLLDQHYVACPDYEQISQAVLQRGVLLGQVLQTARKDFLYSPDPNDLSHWDQKMLHLQKETQEKESYSLETWKQLIQSIRQVNQQTIKLPEGFLIYHLAQACLSELDPYTEIVWPTQSEDFDKRMTGQFAGVGIRITYDNHQLKILEVIPDTPAAATDKLKSGDWIVAIDGQSAKSLSIRCAVRKISGPVGSTVVLTIRRAGMDQNLDVPVQRRKIILPTLGGAVSQGSKRTASELALYRIDADPQIRYLKISGFGSNTAANCKKLLTLFEKEGTKGLIIDLRGNSGGLLDAASEVADLLLDKGVLVMTKPRTGKSLQFHSDPEGFLDGVPLILLVDGASASGAEVVAGILKKAQRAILVGVRTYGKGTVQEVEPLNADGSRIKYTRSFYHFADGSSVPNRFKMEKENKTEWGIVPDVIVENNSRQMRQIKIVQKKLRTAMIDQQLDSSSAEYMELVHSLVENDPQLAASLLVLKTQIIASGIPVQTVMESGSTESEVNNES